MEKLKKIFSSEIFKFVFFGLFANIADYLVFGLMVYIVAPTELDYSYLQALKANKHMLATWIIVLATTIGFVVQVIINYVNNVFLVFKNTGSAKSAKGIITFILISLSALLINMLGTFILYELGIQAWLTKAILVVSLAVYNFTLKKLLIFKKAQPSSSIKETNIDDDNFIK